MSVLAVKEEMLYCPKCQQTYQNGTQRFCTNEGNRLLPAPSSGKSSNQTGGVFSSLLGRIAPTDEIDKKLSPTPRFAKIESVQSDFIPPTKPRVFKTEEEVKAEMQPQPQKPLPRIIKPSEIPTSQAKLGNRQTNPTGRPALTWANPNGLLGQTVKGRYFVVEKLGEDESSIAYLASDKLAAEKKVVVRVLMDEDADDTFTNQIVAEERVSLSLINHPNIARILDSGELLEGKPFIISEYVEGKSVKEMLKQTGQFNSLRAARIIRQVAYALSEVHQN
ncbi:MAG: protein kinase domain-containing protein, partial [Tepidiformaceae bacterium]